MRNKWGVAKVGMSDIEGTKINANSMNPKDFDKLVHNIKETGLSSMIACYKRQEDGKFVIISGNHRYRACLKLGYKDMNILFADEKDISEDEIIALQLSHNSLHGEDDRSILKKLMDEIKDIDYKEMAHISVDDIEVEDVFSGSVVPMSEHYRVSLILYKNDIDTMKELMWMVDDEKSISDVVILADGTENEEKFLDLISKVREDFDIKSSSISFSKLLELAKLGYQHLGTQDTNPDEFQEIE